MQRIILYIALLLMVSGLAFGSIHDVVHAKGDHTELCGVFKTATHGTLPDTQTLFVYGSFDTHFIQPHSFDPVRSYAGMMWSGRGPPL